MTTLAVVLDALVAVILVHTVVNAACLRRPPAGSDVDERVSILLPMRDEAARLVPAMNAVLLQRGLGDCEVLVYDDESLDGTGALVRRLAGDRVQVLEPEPLPAGWLGKPHACARLAAAASGSVLVFVDADVVLAPDAVAGAVRLLRTTRLAFVSPYPRQLSGSWLERLVQPLLQWSWLAFLPLRAAERSRRPSLAAANGQFLVVDARSYRDAGGHAAVRTAVVDDVALARSLVRSGARGCFVDGRDIATCRMYAGARDLVDGYAKSLWSAFGSPGAAVGVTAVLVLLFVVPWALVAITPWAVPAAVGGPLSRLVAAVRAGNRPALDAVTHPLAIIAFAVLVTVSLVRRRRGRLTWKARPVG